MASSNVSLAFLVASDDALFERQRPLVYVMLYGLSSTGEYICVESKNKLRNITRSLDPSKYYFSVYISCNLYLLYLSIIDNIAWRC